MPEGITGDVARPGVLPPYDDDCDSMCLFCDRGAGEGAADPLRGAGEGAADPLRGVCAAEGSGDWLLRIERGDSVFFMANVGDMVRDPTETDEGMAGDCGRARKPGDAARV
jgi:hypothetical protein